MGWKEENKGSAFWHVDLELIVRCAQLVFSSQLIWEDLIEPLALPYILPFWKQEETNEN